MRRASLTLAFCGALVPVAAQALSCAPWSPAQAFDAAQASASRYTVVVGSFSFEPSALPRAEVGTSEASDTLVPATLTGRALARSGFDAPYAKQVRLVVRCALSWCGSMIPNQPYLVFVEHTASGPSVELGPCATVVFPNPTAAVEREMTGCLTSARCSTN